MRGRAPGHRQQAFRRAAREISRVPESELRFLADAGRLQDLPGIGDTTAAVIAEALAGETPQYLQKLLEHAETPGTEAGDALRAQLKGDLHVHSDWSDGGDTIRTMAEKARALGHDYFALTDHSPRLTIAHGLPPERLREQLDVVAELNEEMKPFRILTGVECRHPRRRRARRVGGAARARRRRRGERALEAAHGVGADDAADGRRDREPARRRARPLHGAPARRSRSPAVGVRRRRRDRGVPRVRHRARGQLPARATRSAEGHLAQGRRRGHQDRDQHRRARRRPARVAAVRHRPPPSAA